MQCASCRNILNFPDNVLKQLVVCPFCGEQLVLKEKCEPIYGSYTDPRDGYTYKTVEINGQIWFAENFRYGVSPRCKVPAIGYRQNDSLCEYTNDLAITLAPRGWHLPTAAEYEEMVNFAVGGYDWSNAYKNLVSRKCGGIDRVGFGAIDRVGSGGYYYQFELRFFCGIGFGLPYALKITPSSTTLGTVSPNDNGREFRGFVRYVKDK